MKAIRLARVLAALLMVTAGEAGADCAWVLWSSLSELDPLNPGKLSETAVVWRIHRAVGSQNECTQNQSSLLARWRDEAQRKARLGELTGSPQFAEPDGRITMFHEESGKVVRTFMERALAQTLAAALGVLTAIFVIRLPAVENAVQTAKTTILTHHGPTNYERAWPPAEVGTRVQIDTDLAVLGKIGEFGQPVIRKKADTLLDEFARNLNVPPATSAGGRRPARRPRR